MSRHPSAGLWDTLYRTYAVCFLVLCIKYYFSLFYGANMANHPEEDKFINQQVPEDIKRRERQFANDMENIPFSLVVFVLAFFVQNMANSSQNGYTGTYALCVLIIAFTASRCLYTICYMYALQPYRSIMFFVNVLSTIAAACIAVYSATEVDIAKAYPNIY